MDARLKVLMSRLLLAAVNDESKEDSIETFLNFSEAVAQFDGHSDLFRAVKDAKEMLGIFCYVHGEQVYRLVNDFYALCEEARISGCALSSTSVLTMASEDQK